MTIRAKTFQDFNVWTDGPERMSQQVEHMMSVLRGLEARELPDTADYTAADLHGYLVSLVEGCGPSPVKDDATSAPAGRCWSVSRHTGGMTAPLLLEFVLVPTAIAAATLSRCALQFPLLATSVPDLAPALGDALAYVDAEFHIARGATDPDPRRRLFDILYMGWVPLLLWQNPRLCPPINRRLSLAPHFDFHVEHEMKRQHELLHEVHQEDLRAQRDQKLSWTEQQVKEQAGSDARYQERLIRDLEAARRRLETQAVDPPVMEADHLAPVGTAPKDALDAPVEEDALDEEFLDLTKMAPTLMEILFGQLRRVTSLPVGDGVPDPTGRSDPDPMGRLGRAVRRSPPPDAGDPPKTKSPESPKSPGVGEPEVPHA